MTAPESADEITDTQSLAPDQPSEGPSWEDDETSTSFFLRAVATLLCGGYLAWSQWNAQISTTYQWLRWIEVSVVANLLLPLGIIWFFFGQGVIYLDWLREQRSNAWNYGWNFKDWRRHGKWALYFGSAMLIMMLIYRFTPAGIQAAADYKTNYFPILSGPGDMAILLVTLVIYMFCWEFFFRGFLLFGMAQGFGPLVAIGLQALLFGRAHLGKPDMEYFSAYAGGAILGALCWKEKSFAPAFYVHALIHIIWMVLVYL